jgi:putative CocE/NonD family hydrolase
MPGLIHEPGVEIAMRDGVGLVADIYRPDVDQAVPALVQRTPYGRHWSVTEAYVHPAWYVARGYAVVCQDCRGCGDSAGTFEPFALEGPDGFDTVEWAGNSAWCNGSVGMYGFSYPGVAQLLAASERPPHLRAIAPAMATADVRDPWVFRGGALQLGWIMRWACDLGAQAAARTGAGAAVTEFASLASDPQRLFGAMPVLDAFSPELRKFIPFLERWLEERDNPEYWHALSPNYAEISVPALHVGGWYDTFLSGTIASYRRLVASSLAPQSIVIGPWPHIPWQRTFGCTDFGVSAGSDIDETQRQFFDRWCKHDGDGTSDNESAGTSFARVFSIGDNRWLEASEWPLQCSVVNMHLTSAGRANSLAGDGALTPGPARRELPPDVFVSDPSLPVVDVGGRSCCYPEVTPMGPADQRVTEQRMDVLVYETAPFRSGLFLAGAPRLVVFVLSDRPTIDLVARLCRVLEDGRSVNISDGNLRFDVAPGINEIALSLSATAVRIAEGERIRIDIAGTSFPTLDRNPCTGAPAALAGADEYRSATIAIFHDHRYPSRVEVPRAVEPTLGWA